MLSQTQAWVLNRLNVAVTGCSCLLRIIDSFGTEPAFNYDIFAKAHHLKTQWGMQNLNPQQFFTMFRKLGLPPTLALLTYQ